MRAIAEDTFLTTRAHDFLAAGPADAVSLIAHVCQLPGPPRVVAEHMAEALFAGQRAFARDGEGRWCLAAQLRPDEPPAAAAPRPSLTSLDYVVVDVETTGTRAWGADRITEVAAVVVRQGRVVERFETLVNPQRPIPPMITALTNISWAMVRDAPTFREVCDDLLRVLEGRVFVAHNASFDWAFVSAEVQRATGQRLEGDQLCTVRLARKLLPELRSRRLDSVAHHYGVEIEARHRAGGDALATAHVLLRLLESARCHDCETWDDLQRLLAAGTGRAKRYRRPPAMPRPVDKDTTA